MRRRRAGGDDAMGETDLPFALVVAHDDAVGRIEGGGALDHADLALARQSGKAPSQLADDFVLVGAQRPQVDFRCNEADTVTGHRLRVGDHLGHMQKSLRRDASDVQADATERCPCIHEHDLAAKVCSAECGRVAAWSAADHQHLRLSHGWRGGTSQGRGHSPSSSVAAATARPKSSKSICCFSTQGGRHPTLMCCVDCIKQAVCHVPSTFGERRARVD